MPNEILKKYIYEVFLLTLFTFLLEANIEVGVIPKASYFLIHPFLNRIVVLLECLTVSLLARERKSKNSGQLHVTTGNKEVAPASKLRPSSISETTDAHMDGQWRQRWS